MQQYCFFLHVCCICDSFFLLSLFVTLYIFLHLTVMHSSTFGKGWVGMSACPLVVLACESLHVCTVCIWRCEHAWFCVEVFYALYINFHLFIHSFTWTDLRVLVLHHFQSVSYAIVLFLPPCMSYCIRLENPIASSFPQFHMQQYSVSLSVCYFYGMCLLLSLCLCRWQHLRSPW